jgi:dual specificity phosphatase 12
MVDVDDTFSSYQHHCIDVDDVDYENILEHLPAAVSFIRSGLDAGGSVLIHWLVNSVYL